LTQKLEKVRNILCKRSFTCLSNTPNQTFVINGPQTLLVQDGLQKYCDAHHPEIKAVTMPIWFGKMLAMMAKSAELKDFAQIHVHP
jgi:hypothetical protein